MLNDVINIVLTCDDRYVQHAAVTIISVVKNTKRNVHFYVFDCGILPENLERLKRLDVGSNVLEVVQVQKIDVFENYKYQPEYSPAIMYRLAIPEILPLLDKALYLDCDIVAVGDIGELWDIDLGDKMLGGSVLPYCCRPRYFPDFDKCYFGSGLLLMNLKKMVEVLFFKKAVRTLCAIRYFMTPDQDVLHVLLQNEDWLPLDKTLHRALSISDFNTAVLMHFCERPWAIPRRFMRCLPGRYWRIMCKYYDYLSSTPFCDQEAKFVDYWRSCKVLIKWLLRRDRIVFLERIRGRGLWHM